MKNNLLKMKLSCFLLPFFIQMYHTRYVSTPGNGIRIPLTRTPLTLKKLASTATEMKSYYSGEVINGPGIPLQYHLNSEYYGPVSIGTPSRDFQMIFDTGSPQSWVISKSCNSMRCKENCHESYDHERSITYKNSSQPKCVKYLPYGTGEVSGFCSNDTISMDGVPLKNIEFLEAVNITKEFPEGPYEGLVGLRYSISQQSDNIITQLCQIVKRENKFSFYFTKNTSDPNGGELTLCGVDESKFRGPLNYINETQPIGTWYIPIDSVSMRNGENYIFNENLHRAIIDTGSALIFGPDKIITAIYKVTNANLNDGKVNCEAIRKFPNITFAMGKQNYTIGAEDYILKAEVNSTIECQIGFGGIASRREWILGDVFLRKYYSVYDIENHRIGFAESIHKRTLQFEQNQARLKERVLKTP